MPTRFAPSMRARDEDRTNACATLDRGLADGQMSTEEHATRIELAMEAPTLADLHSLIEDLQGETELAPMARPSSGIVRGKNGRRFRFVLAVLVPVMVIALSVSAIRSCAVADDPVHQFGPAGFLELGGLERVVSVAQQEWNSTTLDDVSIYPNYVVYTRADPERPALGIDTIYRDGSMSTFGSPSARKPSAPTVDIGALNLPAVAGVLAGIGESLNLTRVDSMYLLVRTIDVAPEVMIFAENEDGENGYLSLHPDGTFASVQPWDPEG